MNTAAVAKAAQACFQRCPTIILGSGASMPHGLPSMRELGDYLNGNLKTSNDAERDAWISVKSDLENHRNLEFALGPINTIARHQ